MRIALTIVLIGILSSTVVNGQSKKVDSLLAVSYCMGSGSQVIFLTDYTITSAVNSKSFFADPAIAGRSTIIHFTGRPDYGSAATALNIDFVADAAIYPKAEYHSAVQTIYISMSMSQYPVIMSQLERTIDKTNGKTLKGIYREDVAGNRIITRG